MGHNAPRPCAPARTRTILDTRDRTEPLWAEGLACLRGERLLFRDLSFSVGPGEACLVRGPNGSGKTSLLRILAGLLRPDAGRVGGVESVHYCGHSHALNPVLTLRRNMTFWSGLMGGDVDACAEMVGLGRALDVPAAALSAGQRQRAALARLLLAPRRVWLLDEPTAALDQAGTSLVARMVEDHLATGAIVVAATHRALPLAAPIVAVDLG